MDQETLFTASKWDILKELSSGSKSPMQLAKLSNTSVANISQQLRLLEMAGLVQSKRISNRDKGQPRLLYSLAGNHSFLIASSKDFVDKKFLQLSNYNKIILKIWFLDKPELHYYLEKAFWYAEEHIKDIDAIILEMDQPEHANELNLLIISDKPELKNKLKKIAIKNPGGQKKTIMYDIKNKKQLSRLLSSAEKDSGKLYSIYDPSNLTNQKKEGEK